MRGFRLEQIVRAGAPAALIAVRYLDELQLGDGSQQRARLRAYAEELVSRVRAIAGGFRDDVAAMIVTTPERAAAMSPGRPVTIQFQPVSMNQT
jgi:hypothetical protein